MHSRSAEYHISSSVGSYAQISVRQRADLFLPDLLIPSDLLFLQIHLHTVSLLSSHLCRLLTEQTEGRTYVLPVHRPHQMQVQCEPHRYHRSVLRNQRMLHSSLFCAVSHKYLQRSQITAHTLCTQGLFLCMFQVLRMLLCQPLHRQVCQEQCRTVPLPYNKYIRQQLLLSHKSLPGLHRVPR